MSLIIALKDEKNNRVIVGADSILCTGNIKSVDYKIFKSINNPDVIIAHAGDGRYSQLLEFDKVLFSGDFDFTKEYIVTVVVPRLLKIAEEHAGEFNPDDTATKIPADLIFAYKNKAYEVYGNGFVFELHDFLVAGIGYEVATGALSMPTNLSAYDRVVEAIKIAGHNLIGVDDNYMVLTTDNKKE